MRLPNGYGSVSKLSGKRRNPYRVRITIGRDETTGQYIQKALGYYHTKKEALEALAAYNADPYDLTSEKLTFAQVYERWSESYFPKLSASAQGTHKVAYKHCVPLYNLPMVEIRLFHLQGLIDTCGLNYPSRERIKNLCQMLFAYAIRYEVVKENPAQYIDLGAKEEKEAIHKPFTPEELDILWNHLDVPWVDTILILCYTGMRYGELLKMRTEDVHLYDRYMIGGSKTDAGKNRIIPIHHRIVPLIERYYTPDRKTLLPNMGQSTYRMRFAKAVEECDLPPHLTHDCRHTFASRMDAAGANIRAIKAIMGHTGGDVTDKVYIHKALEDLLKNVELLN